MSLAVMLAVPLGVFIVVSGLAWALGTADLGLAATFGVLAFAATTVAVLLRDAPPPDDRGSYGEAFVKRQD